MDDLKLLGVNLVPAVTVGDRIAHGWNPDAYAKLLGIDYAASPKLSPTELAERLDRILETIERLVRAVPDDQILFIPAERKRTVGQLAYHAFRLSIAARCPRAGSRSRRRRTCSTPWRSPATARWCERGCVDGSRPRRNRTTAGSLPSITARSRGTRCSSAPRGTPVSTCASSTISPTACTSNRRRRCRWSSSPACRCPPRCGDARTASRIVTTRVARAKGRRR